MERSWKASPPSPLKKILCSMLYVAGQLRFFPNMYGGFFLLAVFPLGFFHKENLKIKPSIVHVQPVDILSCSGTHRG